jgi:cell division septum initiation protein DivIVA
MSVMQSTIIAMKELAIMSQQTNDSFTKEAQELVSEVEGQLETVGQFRDQEMRIKSLQQRIQEGRTKIQGLGERVDIVRERIEAWERADREWQERTRKRLKVIWIIMSVVFFAILLLFLSAQYASPVLESAGINTTNASFSTILGLDSDSSNTSASEAVSSSPAAPEKEKVLVPSILRDRVEEEDHLRLFDEL